MAGKAENMKRLTAERERLKREIEALQNQLKGIEKAIALVSSEGTKEDERASPRQRGKNVKETVLSLVQNAGPNGINVNGVLDAARELGIHLERGSVSSLLSRMKRESVLDMTDGRYFIPPHKPGGIQPMSH